MVETVILANGEFPKKDGAAGRLLAAAKRVVCCDGAADVYRRRFRKWPDVVIGDFDSLVPSALSRTGVVTDDSSASASRRERRRYGRAVDGEVRGAGGGEDGLPGD